MLVLTRKPGQIIRVGENITIEVISVNGEHVKIGISAPRDITILREEIYEIVQGQNKESVLNDSNSFTLAEIKLDELLKKSSQQNNQNK